MKSGPTLKPATLRPVATKAAISPVATVVLPAPECVPAMMRRSTIRSTPRGLPDPSSRPPPPARSCDRSDRPCQWGTGKLLESQTARPHRRGDAAGHPEADGPVLGVDHERGDATGGQ